MDGGKLGIRTWEGSEGGGLWGLWETLEDPDDCSTKEE